MRHSSPEIFSSLCFVIPLGRVISQYWRVVSEKTFCLPFQSSFLKRSAVFINEGMKQSDRLEKLNSIAIEQMKILSETKTVKKLK